VTIKVGWDTKHDLSKVPEKYRKAVKVLLEWEGNLSDGYYFYCEFTNSEEAALHYGGDYVLSALEAIAREIIDE
jgi:hypothetical protein